MKVSVNKINFRTFGAEKGPVLVHNRCHVQMELAARMAEECAPQYGLNRNPETHNLSGLISVTRDRDGRYWVVSGLLRFALMEPLPTGRLPVVCFPNLRGEDVEYLAWADLLAESLLRPQGGGFSPDLLLEVASNCPGHILFERTGLSKVSRRRLAEYLGIDRRSFQSTRRREQRHKSEEGVLSLEDLGLLHINRVDNA